MQNSTKEKLASQLQMLARKVARARARQSAAPLHEAHGIVQIMQHISDAALTPHEQQKYGDIITGLDQAIAALPTNGQLAEIASICQLLDEIIAYTQKMLATERAKKIVMFLPYKASMWDSLESVWQAAKEQDDVEAIVMPIPYADRNPDGTCAEVHYELHEYPDYVPVVDCRTIDLPSLHPDVIFIHNPYDNCNSVTSVDSAYYSDQLKKCCNILVYIPYFSTAGYMGDVQASCPAFANVDYIIAQSEEIAQLYDEAIPREKILPLGSPKFDKVLRLCAAPPEPPVAWREKMAGRKIYFYNTSLGGMLQDTHRFLQKMKYVFHCFQQCPEACLLWRPHPLLESTFRSMRSEYYAEFQRLKDWFLQTDFGIYDDTPDVDQTVALSDAYVGDIGTSITSLFGVSGKPIFALNNLLNREPENADWRGETIINAPERNWMLTTHNQLYQAEDGHHFHFARRLSEYTSGMQYGAIVSYEDRLYICPFEAHDILVMRDGDIVKRIPLPKLTSQPGLFSAALKVGHYIFLRPLRYPCLVRLDMRNDELAFLKGHYDEIVRQVGVEWLPGGWCDWHQEKLLIASPVDAHVLIVDVETMETQSLEFNINGYSGCLAMAYDPVADLIWLLPYAGLALIYWNPLTGQWGAHELQQPDFICHHFPTGIECMLRPFSSAAFTQDKVMLAPCWGNMLLAVDRQTGAAEEWLLPAAMQHDKPSRNNYYLYYMNGLFLPDDGDMKYRYFDYGERRLYELDFATGSCQEAEISIDPEEAAQHSPGFGCIASWMRYGCEEGAFNTLPHFLRGQICGQPFDKEKQLAAFRDVNASADGDCGEKVIQFVLDRLAEAY